MEGSIGFFGQFKYVFKGVIKPRFFNRLGSQSKFCYIGYTVIMAIVSVIVFCGLLYLRTPGSEGFQAKVENAIKSAPNFSYSSGKVVFEENTVVQLGEKSYLVFNSDIDVPDKDYYGKVEILVDWSTGVRVLIFNGKTISTRVFFKLFKISVKYTDIANILGLPANFDRDGLARISTEKFNLLYLIFAGVCIIPFVAKAFIFSTIFAGIGFGLAKIVKQPYNYKELYIISLYIAGVTNIIRSALNASPIKPGMWILNFVFLLIGTAYLFFAIIGSTEESGPSSTIVFNKPSGKAPEFEAPDPFARKNFKPAEFAERTRPSAPAPAPVPEPAPAPVVETPVVYETSEPAETVSSVSATASSLYAASTVASESSTYDYSASAQTESYSAPVAESVVYAEPAPAPVEETKTHFSAKAATEEERRGHWSSSSTSTTHASSLFHTHSEMAAEDIAVKDNSADKKYSTAVTSRFPSRKEQESSVSSLFHMKTDNNTETNTQTGYSDAFGKKSRFEPEKKSSIFETIDLHTKNSYSQPPATGYSDIISRPEDEMVPLTFGHTYEDNAIEGAEEEVVETNAFVRTVPASPMHAEPEPAPVYVEPEPEPASVEPISAVIKSDIGTYGGLGQLSSSGKKKGKPKYDRPITAPDAYNGLYYSGSDEEESYESNYGSGTLLDRGGLYGKTIGGEASSNPFASVLGSPTPSVSTGTSTFSSGNFGNTIGGTASSSPFTTKEGSAPFGNGGFYLSNPPRNNVSASSHTTVTKGGKTVNRYSDDDFAAWERETYAEEFNRPRGSFGNNIF
ncbi:MAG: DUF1189 family protein [Lachnospiraceae bacterium]|nr:DUF1189 family protein [Lachnospiraceae bacterium]